MSPSTLIWPPMKACIAACWLPSSEHGAGHGVGHGELGRGVVEEAGGEVAVGEVELAVALGPPVHDDVEDDAGRHGRAAAVLVGEGLRRVEPLVGKEWCCGHRGSPSSS